MKLMILSMITHEEGSKGGLWRGLMKCGSKDFESFSRNLNFLFQKLDIEEEATRGEDFIPVHLFTSFSSFIH